jgi:hypothetical protein
MATAMEHINAALRLLGAKVSGEPITAEEAQDSLKSLNDMIGLWLIESDMIYTVEEDSELDELSTFATISTSKSFSSGYDSAIKYNLALELAPEWRASIPEVLYRNAMTSKANCKRKNKNVPLMTIETEVTNGTNYRDTYDITEGE